MSVSYAGNEIPAFLLKLWRMVDEPSCDDLISWSTEGNSFIVYDQAELSKEILPKFFKHGNFASFVRQLNMYGFRKIIRADQGSLKSAEKENLEFCNPNFKKNNFSLIVNMKRKISTNVRTAAAETKVKYEDVERLLTDVHEMKGRQSDVNQQIETLTKDKKAMRDELSSLRQKSDQQQAVINKLIHFLLRLLYTKTERIGPVGRKRPLALLERESRFPASSKIVALPDHYSDEVLDVGNATYTIASPTDTNISVVAVPDIIKKPSTTMSLPVSVVDAITTGGIEMTQPAGYTNSSSLATATNALADPQDLAVLPHEAYSQAARPQSIEIQSDLIPVDPWETSLSPTSVSIASLLSDDPGCLMPQVPECEVTDISSLMEHLDSLDEGIDSVRNVFETSDAFDSSVVTDLFTPNARSPAATLDSNTQMLLDALAAGEEPSQNAVRNLQHNIAKDGMLLPISEVSTAYPHYGGVESPVEEIDTTLPGKDNVITKAVVPITGAQATRQFDWVSSQTISVSPNRYEAGITSNYDQKNETAPDTAHRL
ncbi:heat shock factor protein-like isoform X2 [Corticium candelabrum]|uniref:heat shock factor protein-like isoform X2 n=1 Tax=Corticium candelabrum TaxID=121492 RepID=UPI002E26DD02|nr:heat shock factor protein-like isoform X2 [Corticium candelabrum]